MATSDNPLVSIPDKLCINSQAGSYSFIAGSSGASATRGVELSESTLSDGSKQYTSISGDAKGLRLSVSGSVTSATVFLGRVYPTVFEFIEDVISSTGVLEKVSRKPPH